MGIRNKRICALSSSTRSSLKSWQTPRLTLESHQAPMCVIVTFKIRLSLVLKDIQVSEFFYRRQVLFPRARYYCPRGVSVSIAYISRNLLGTTPACPT